jgi:hypothetical protein
MAKSVLETVMSSLSLAERFCKEGVGDGVMVGVGTAVSVTVGDGGMVGVAVDVGSGVKVEVKVTVG